jgi:hypothetical protein
VAAIDGRQGASNAMAGSRLLGRAPVLTAAFTSREIDDGSCAASLEAFGRVLQGMGPDAGRVPGERWMPHAA